jgi:hypothetical protein
MKIDKDYILLKFEWDVYHHFKPSLLQKILWFFFPTLTSINWLRYKDVERNECV